MDQESPTLSYLEISEYISVDCFEQILFWILQNGDRKTYRNKDNHNPYYRCRDFDVYLNPYYCPGQVDNRTRHHSSDYNEIVIYDPGKPIQYYTLRLVRQGDAEYYELSGYSSVYLISWYDKDMHRILESLISNYLDEIKLLKP